MKVAQSQSLQSRSRRPGTVPSRRSARVTGVAVEISTAARSPGAAFSLITKRCYVYFDKPLQPRDLIASDWYVRTHSWTRTLSWCIARVDRVQFETSPGRMRAGPDVVSYYGVLAKLRDEDGLEVEPFFGFPITIVT